MQRSEKSGIYKGERKKLISILIKVDPERRSKEER